VETVIVRFDLHIDTERLKSYYQGVARNIQVRAHDGRLVRFPANAVRRYITRDGVHGVFELEFDDRNHRLVALRKLP